MNRNQKESLYVALKVILNSQKTLETKVWNEPTIRNLR